MLLTLPPARSKIRSVRSASDATRDRLSGVNCSPPSGVNGRSPRRVRTSRPVVASKSRIGRSCWRQATSRSSGDGASTPHPVSAVGYRRIAWPVATSQATHDPAWPSRRPESRPTQVPGGVHRVRGPGQQSAHLDVPGRTVRSVYRGQCVRPSGENAVRCGRRRGTAGPRYQWRCPRGSRLPPGCRSPPVGRREKNSGARSSVSPGRAVSGARGPWRRGHIPQLDRPWPVPVYPGDGRHRPAVRREAREEELAAVATPLARRLSRGGVVQRNHAPQIDHGDRPVVGRKGRRPEARALGRDTDGFAAVSASCMRRVLSMP